MAVDEPTQRLSAADAKALAQRIAFGPLVFQAASALLSLGVLAALWEERNSGATIAELQSKLGHSSYALTVLCQSGHAAGLLELDEASGRYSLSAVGYHLLRDDLTRANFDFVRDVCYAPAMDLEQSLRDGVPVGLSRLAPEANTVYEGLSDLPAAAMGSWHRFDHFYSDAAFRDALPFVLGRHPSHVLDVGANTGRWAAVLLQGSPDVSITLVDHAPQLRVAMQRLTELGYADRVCAIPQDLLAPIALDVRAEVVWLSQLLDCFGESDVVRILVAARQCLTPGGVVLVLEPCWDLQKHEAASYCLRQASLYFACVANGQSRMYDSATLQRAIETAGLSVVERHDQLGLGHSLFCCAPAETVTNDNG